MKKRFSKKLALKRETILKFEDQVLEGAVGGNSLYNSCDPISVRRCPSEACTAGSSLCTLESNCC